MEITHLKGVFFDEAKAQNVRTSGITSADSLNLIIPFDVEVIGENKEYKEPKMYQESPENAWTIQEGDFVVKGLVDKEILAQSDLGDNFDNVYRINTVDAKLFGSRNLWHWEVGAS
ncbi:MAG: hypothetical protein HFE57_06970 [Firmicutes bacterium]|jgi:hypothetical protein|nr:hypothetical protein [Bacillota bacterium]